MSKHTPGYWHAVGLDVWADDGSWVANTSSGKDYDQNLANARLIAAVKHLLFLAQDVLNSGAGVSAAEFHAQCEEAIAKAKGVKHE